MIAILRQRLPCVGLVLCAALGIVVGRWTPIPGWVFAFVAAMTAAAALRVKFALPLAVALGFAAAQSWQYRESASARLAARLTLEPQTCEAEIIVLDQPAISAASPLERCRFPARLLTLEIGDRAWQPDCRVLVRWNGPPPAYGARYRVRAAIANCPSVRNPGAFDYTAWLANDGIRSQLDVLRASDARELGWNGRFLVAFALASRAWIERTLALGIAGTPEATLIRGMTIGDTTGAPDAFKNSISRDGHVSSLLGKRTSCRHRGRDSLDGAGRARMRAARGGARHHSEPVFLLARHGAQPGEPACGRHAFDHRGEPARGSLSNPSE